MLANDKDNLVRTNDSKLEASVNEHSGSSAGYQAHPLRIQRKRTKGWRMPAGAVYVGRPSKWGNPMSVNLAVGRTLDDVMRFFRSYAEKFIANYRPNCDPQYRGLNIEELRGKQLACWCPIVDENGEYCQCHADVLLSLANGMTMDEVRHENIKAWKRSQETSG